MPEETPVPNPTEPDIKNVIESAMSRLAPRTPGHEAAPDPAKERKSLGRRDYDLALAQRLEQLQTAMGESPSTVPPMTHAAGAPLAAIPPRPPQSITLVATALISALAGAGAMWLAIGSPPPAESAQTQIVSAAPVPVAAALAPVTPVAQAAPAASAEPAPPPPPAVNSDEDQARQLLDAWRQAWSSRDSDAYLSFYSPDFTPADGQKRADWAAARRKNLASRPDISVNAREVNIERIDDQQLKLAFLQDYAAGSYRETAQPKSLLLVRQGGKWLIAGEWQGAMPKAAPGK